MGIDENIREIQKGILKWYPFREGAKCLYIGKKMDAVFEMLCDAMDAVCVEPEDIVSTDEKYDYVIAIESLEILPDIAETIKTLSQLLRPEGHMLLGFNNRFGTRYFFGDRDPYTKNIFDGIEDYRRAYSKKEDAFVGRCYDKQTLLDIFDSCGLTHQNFSVFPDLKNVQILLRDDYESNEDFSIRVLPTYHHADTVFLEEEFVYNSLQKNHMLHSMANAFLFDCTFDDTGLDVLQVTSSMGRAKEDSFITMIHGKTNGDGNAVGESVEKLPVYPEGVDKLRRMVQIAENLRNHGIETVEIELKDNSSLIMPYLKVPTAQAYLKELLIEDENAFVEKLDEFVDLVCSSSNHVSEDVGDGEGILLECGYPDLVPLNAFYLDGKFVFFDQEFAIENFPANMTIQRVISAMGPAINANGKKYSVDDLYKRYGISEKLSKWQAMEWDFISKLRKEKEMAPYFSRMRYDGNKVYSNRLRMNFSAEEYMSKFVNLFKGLENKKVIVFGSGQFAKQFMQMYGGDYDVAAVIDNRKDKHGEDFYGVKINGVEVLKEFKPGSYRVIVCIKNFLSVMNQLEELGVKDYCIFDPSQQYMRERRSGAEVTRDNEMDKGTSETTKKKYHIGYIAGVFDLFHVGHLEKFKLAKEQCDYLIVGLVTDEGVRLYKKTEPFIPFEDRKAMLEACKYVDEVVKIPPNFGGTKEAWRMYGFDVQFSGSDYANDPSWEAEKQFLEDHGVDMVFFPYTESTSSSKLKALIDKKLL